MQESIKSTESIISLMNNAPFLTVLFIFTFLVIWFTLRMRLRLLKFVEISIVSIINKELGKKINVVNRDYKEFQEQVKNEFARIRRHEHSNSKAQLDALNKLNSNFDKYGDKL